MLTDYEKRVLERTPEQALTFLRASATKVEIRASLFAVGYSEAEQQAGWKLLLAASGYRSEALPASDDDAPRAAIAEIDAWDEPGFRRVGAALGRLHPEQNQFVFDELKAARGQGALVSVSTLLDRLDALESAPDREATREADHAALATLERRGIGRQLRAHLRSQLATALRAKPPDPVPQQPMNAEREQALRDLRAWYLDWAETAWAVISRRDHLIMLGLSQRKRRARDEDGSDDIDVEEINGEEAENVNAAPGANGIDPVAAAEPAASVAPAAE